MGQLRMMTARAAVTYTEQDLRSLRVCELLIVSLLLPLAERVVCGLSEPPCVYVDVLLQAAMSIEDLDTKIKFWQQPRLLALVSYLSNHVRDQQHARLLRQLVRIFQRGGCSDGLQPKALQMCSEPDSANIAQAIRAVQMVERAVLLEHRRVWWSSYVLCRRCYSL